MDAPKDVVDDKVPDMKEKDKEEDDGLTEVERELRRLKEREEERRRGLEIYERDMATRI